ncbi:hypothetical protein E1B28_006765 [Marasmius oreades]|uniref:Uncharacterized protein n=1 Tax=Marasmius oreades TaxID=181124 RepID=A0A9P8AAQ0_9AGAR|nr:uncharacterized protein E1B28_006765 [Marasmius oreades]KAG7096089.1 hypothetical protein E1B28_006765 [Marasmius oreades]
MGPVSRWTKLEQGRRGLTEALTSMNNDTYVIGPGLGWGKVSIKKGDRTSNPFPPLSLATFPPLVFVIVTSALEKNQSDIHRFLLSGASTPTACSWKGSESPKTPLIPPSVGRPFLIAWSVSKALKDGRVRSLGVDDRTDESTVTNTKSINGSLYAPTHVFYPFVRCIAQDYGRLSFCAAFLPMDYGNGHH